MNVVDDMRWQTTGVAATRRRVFGLFFSLAPSPELDQTPDRPSQSPFYTSRTVLSARRVSLARVFAAQTCRDLDRNFTLGSLKSGSNDSETRVVHCHRIPRQTARGYSTSRCVRVAPHCAERIASSRSRARPRLVAWENRGKRRDLDLGQDGRDRTSNRRLSTPRFRREVQRVSSRRIPPPSRCEGHAETFHSSDPGTMQTASLRRGRTKTFSSSSSGTSRSRALQIPPRL